MEEIKVSDSWWAELNEMPFVSCKYSPFNFILDTYLLLLISCFINFNYYQFKMSDEIFCLYFFLPVLNLILFKALGLSPA
jgi:hypothetical protein